jgi:DNA-binding transcriptional MerR regulator/mannose-6-phosphate isomerase-like protein (cupin superfamily)
VSHRVKMTTIQRPASSTIAVMPESNGSPLGIGPVAKTVGLSPSTLRAWEAAGLSAPQRDAWGRRWYSRSETKRLHEIKRIRDEEGLSLREINQRLIERHGGHPDTVSPNHTEHRVAQRLRSMRSQLGLTVRQVAERTDLSASYVSSVENGSIRPSVSGLLKLSQVYGANILSFYGPSPEPRRRLVRSGEAEVIAMGDPGVGVALLTPHEGAIELHVFELAPGASSGGSYRHDGDEFWYVLSGTLSVWVDDEFFRLEAGDCLSFASTDEHRFANLTQGVTTFLGGNTPSTF